MAGADLTANYERVVAKPASEPYSQTVRFTNLSGSERQGVAIGQAMRYNADLIVLDEPTATLIGAVDAELRRIIIVLLIEFRTFLGEKPLASWLATD
jgi:ABC-type branched-subunit amino acid transport system ATPase component